MFNRASYFKMTSLLKTLLDEVKAITNYYSTHLGEVDKNNNVYSTENIFNHEYFSLVKKGTRITSKVADHILNHQLLKPIELQVQLNNNIAKEALLDKINIVVDKYPDLKHLYEISPAKKFFIQIVRSYILSPILIQKLTVFAQQLPLEFEKTLFCTILAVIIAFEAKLDKNEIRNTYLAGLCHDLGLLHVFPEIHNKNILSISEWSSLQTHTLSGYLFINHIERDYSDVAVAVLEHHERCDGSGYPLGKTKKQLGLIGQVIGMADSLQAIRIKKFEEIGRNLRDAIPFLQMNPAIYTEKIYRATVSIIKKIPLPNKSAHSFEDINTLISHLIERGEKLNNASLLIRLLLHLSNQLESNNNAQAMLHVIAPFFKMIKQSGLVEDHILIWLQHIKESQDYRPLNELCELELMQNELYWQLKKARTSFNAFLEQEPNAGSEEIMQQLNSMAEQIDKIL